MFRFNFFTTQHMQYDMVNIMGYSPVSYVYLLLFIFLFFYILYLHSLFIHILTIYTKDYHVSQIYLLVRGETLVSDGTTSKC